jgi:hypothetical protein
VAILGGASSNLIGGLGQPDATGSSAFAGNLMSGNTEVGVLISGASANLVQGNFIGTNLAGDDAFANSHGVVIQGTATGNTIGGIFFDGETVQAAGNLISGNTNAGVQITGSGATANQVAGNFIGTNLAGDDDVANAVGVVITAGASSNTIGGTLADPSSQSGGTVGGGNLISGNTGDGVFIGYATAPTGSSGDQATTLNTVQGNFIGTTANGLGRLGNGNDGVKLAYINGSTADATAGNLIGGTGVPPASLDLNDVNPGNVISANGRAGVEIIWDVSTGGQLGDNTVRGNYIGTNAAGTAPLGNTIGVLFDGDAAAINQNSAAGNTRNLIAANIVAVQLAGGASGNTLTGLRIGDDMGSNPLAEGLENGTGLLVLGSGNFIGTAGGTANVIYNNYDSGVVISGSGATGNVLHNTFIGVNNDAGNSTTGTDAANNTVQLRNDGSGIVISNGARQNTIGGTVDGSRNVISNNTFNGVLITGSATSGNQVLGNFIGTNLGGTAGQDGSGNFLGNRVGVAIQDAPDNSVRGGNVISNNSFSGVEIGGTGATGNVVAGNTIGAQAGGNAPLGNGVFGVYLFGGASGNTIGTSVAAPSDADRNLISGNGTSGFGAGVRLEGFFFSEGPNTSGNLVAGNYIGTNAAGTAPLGNNGDGVSVFFAPGNTIGGDTTSLGNLISGNTGNGVHIEGFDVFNFAPGTLVEGNLIGTDITGTRATSGALSLGNSLAGVLLDGTAFNTIGGASTRDGSGRLSGAGNLISNNGTDGITIQGFSQEQFSSGAGGNTVQGNFIGTNIFGTSGLANTQDGVFLRNGATGNLIGHLNATVNRTGNTIAFNGRNGVTVGADADDGGTVGNSIVGNSIFSNVGLGIDLGNNGVTKNDSLGHLGPNQFQNFPVFSSAILDGNTITVQGSLSSSPGKYRIEFFVNSTGDPSGHGQGQTLVAVLDSVTLNSSYAFKLSFSASGGTVVTSTATNLDTGDTSEFSAALTAKPPEGPVDQSVVRAVTDSVRRVVPPIPLSLLSSAGTTGSVNLLAVASHEQINLITEYFMREPLTEAPGEIHGRIFDDPKAVGQITADTIPLSGQIVFLDTNRNGIRDPGEKWTVTNDKGEFSFTGLPVGQYRVVPELDGRADLTFSNIQNNLVELRSGSMVYENVVMAIRYRPRRRPSSENRGQLPLNEDGRPGLALRDAGPAVATLLLTDLADGTPAVPAPPFVTANVPTVPPAPLPEAAPAWWQWLWSAVLVGPWHYLRRRVRTARPATATSRDDG